MHMHDFFRYVHIAPEEPKQVKSKRPKRPQPAPEKHYKILFIKVIYIITLKYTKQDQHLTHIKSQAPDPPSLEDQEIELPPAPEQKTLVYVLLKKPEFGAGLSFPTPAPTKPSKPEVYFIRYKGGKKRQGTSSTPSSQYGSPSIAKPTSQSQFRTAVPSSGSHYDGTAAKKQQSASLRSQYGAPVPNSNSNVASRRY